MDNIVPIDGTKLEETLMDAVASAPRPGFRERFNSRRDARRLAGGRPVWAYTGVAVAVVALAFGSYMVGDRFIGGGQPVASSIGGGSGVELLQKGAPSGIMPPVAPDYAGTQFEGGPENQTQRSAKAVSGASSVANDSMLPVPPGSGGRPSDNVQLVKMASLSVHTKTFDQSWTKLSAIASGLGGYTSDAGFTKSQSGKDTSGNITIRVPSDKLDTAIAQISKLGTLESSSISTSDVSRQAVDLDARIRSAEGRETSLLSLLAQAKSVSEILEVRSTLDETRSNIEQMKAERESIANNVSYSSVSVFLTTGSTYPNGPVPPPSVLAEGFDQAIRASGVAAAGLLIILGFAVPFAALGLIVFLVARLFRRRRPA